MLKNFLLNMFEKQEYMAYINKYNKKSIYSSFLKIKGIGNSVKNLNMFLKCIGLNNLKVNKKLFNFNKNQENINFFLLAIFLEKKIGKIVDERLKFFFELKHCIGSYRYIQSRLGLPVNGQRTHTNSKTAKSLKKNNVI